MERIHSTPEKCSTDGLDFDMFGDVKFVCLQNYINYSQKCLYIFVYFKYFLYFCSKFIYYE